MNLLRMCPCFRWVKRQVAKHQKRSLLYDGAMFSRRRAAKEALQKAADKISAFAGSLFGSKSETSNDGDDVGFERVRVYLRPDGTCLDVNDSDELIYLHDVQCVKSVDKDGLRLLGIAGGPSKARCRTGKPEISVAALQEAIAEATEKPPPRGVGGRRAASRWRRHSQRERDWRIEKAADARKRLVPHGRYLSTRPWPWPIGAVAVNRAPSSGRVRPYLPASTLAASVSAESAARWPSSKNAASTPPLPPQLQLARFGSQGPTPAFLPQPPPARCAGGGARPRSRGPPLGTAGRRRRSPRSRPSSSSDRRCLAARGDGRS